MGTEDNHDWLVRVAAQTPFLTLPGRFGGTERYELIEEVGEGGFGIVYSAIDHQQGGTVALKVLRRGSKELIRFKREFRALADVSHPNLVRLYELHAAEPHWFFTMELVEGMPFAEFARKNPARLRATLVQLVQGLSALHRAGIVHCDIKPSNVLVRPDGRLAILDFGLVVLNDVSQSIDFAGTPLYMAPEQFGGERPTEATDWYAVGVMLYEALAGRVPFDGPPPVVLDAKRRDEPTPPSQLAPRVDPDLESLCMALLQRDPGARPDGVEVLRRLRADSDAVAPSVRGELHGRERELRILRAGFEQTRAGRRTVTVVRGPSGIGKTALLRSFVDDVRGKHPGALVLAGRCYEHETVPYKALDPIVDELARHLAKSPEAEVESLLPKDAATLAHLFPVLRQVSAIECKRPQKRGMDPFERRARGMAALRELLASWARRRPVVLCVDDLQWGDVDSAALLAELVRPPDPPAICFVGSFRAEEAATSPLLARLAELRSSLLAGVPIVEIALSPLPLEESQRMAEGLLAELGQDPSRAEAIARASGGTPFFVQELVLAREASVGGLPTLIERRIAQLPNAARRLLQTLAVVGRPIDGELAGRAAEVVEEQRDALVVLRAEHLVRGREQEGRRLVEPYHDRIREAVVRALDPEEKRGLHARIARSLEAAGGDPAELLLHHRESGDVKEAARAAVRAAMRAAETLAFDRAARLYRTAIDLHGEDDASRPGLFKLLGDALANAGRGSDAATAYRCAARGAPPLEALELDRRAAEELLRSGYLDEGLQILGSLLAAVQVRGRRSQRRALLSLAWHRSVLALRGPSYRARDAATLSPESLARIDVLYAAQNGLAQVDPISGAEFQARGLRLALKMGEPRRVARALVAEGCFVGIPGERTRRRAARLLDLAEQLSIKVGDAQNRGRVILARGLNGYLRGDWREARSQLEAGEEFVRTNCTGMAWELAAGQIFLIDTLYWLGELAEVARQAPARIRDAEARGDLYASVGLCAIASPGAWLTRDDPTAARQEVEKAIGRWSAQGFFSQHFDALISAMNADLYQGDGPAALDRAGSKRPALERSLLLKGQVVRIKIFEAEGRAALAAALAGIDAPSMIARVRGSVRRLLAEDTAWARSLAALLSAGLTLLDGDPAEAARRYAQAEEVLAQAGLAAHAVVACRARGRLLGADGTAMVDEADRWLRERSVLCPDRFAKMLAPER